MDMRECSIIIPLVMARSSQVHHYVQEDLCALFGGYTRHEASGAWKNAQGTIVAEAVVVYTAATDEPDAGHTRANLFNLARYVARHGAQETVYIRGTDGIVEVLTRAELAPDATTTPNSRNPDQPLAAMFDKSVGDWLEKMATLEGRYPERPVVYNVLRALAMLARKGEWRNT